MIDKTWTSNLKFGPRGRAGSALRSLVRRVCRAALGLLSLAAASVALAQAYDYVGQFGSFGTGNGQFMTAAAVAVDPISRNIVVVDYQNYRVQMFDSTGHYLSQFGSYGSGDGQFVQPVAVAIDPATRNILVADATVNRIQIFSSAGVYLSQFGSTGVGLGQFEMAAGVAVDPSTSNIFVTDSGNNRVEMFGPTGIFLEQFGVLGSGDGQFNDPEGVAVDPASSRLVVAEANDNNRVQVFSTAGAYVSQFGTFGTANGELQGPIGVTIDPITHNVIVADTENHRIEIFDSSGNYLSQFGSYGSGPGEFVLPVGVAVDPVSGNLLVADWGNFRVQMFARASTASGSAQVVEFYDVHDDLYFMTASATEAAAIDSGAANVGSSTWSRTGLGFSAHTSPGPGNDVCRFYDANIPPVGVHFYTAIPAECASVRASLPQWQFETGTAFNIAVPSDGSCAAGQTPVYRYFDQRVNENWRFVTDLSVDSAMLAKGWANEGVQMCAGGS